MKKIFLGGTCNGSDWRNTLIPMLKINYFNPVVDEWNDSAYWRELYERHTCDLCLYVITAKMKGVYSIAEVIDDVNKRPDQTILCISDFDGTFEKDLHKSLVAVAQMVVNNGGRSFDQLSKVATYINTV
ncbi:MAG: nucleoside 2-deoxyribosyltransferase domain-containing protein [Bacteroidota bacterium]